MRAPASGTPAGGADLIALHPAMRRILDTQRAWVDGGRLLAYKTALELDMLRHHPEPERRAAAQLWCSLVTPMMKAAFTEQAFHGGSDCLQVFGGHGYVREWGIEQNVRDARVTMIYEGTNEIQAIDLLVRKVVVDGGQGMRHLLALLAAELPHDAACHERFAQLNLLSEHIVLAAKSDSSLPYWVADDYLRAFALALLGWAWGRIDTALADTGLPDYAARWGAPSRALTSWVLPEFAMRSSIIMARCAG